MTEEPSEQPRGLRKLAPQPGEEPAGRAGFIGRMRNYLLTGLIVAGPIGITLYIVWWVITSVDNWVKPLLPKIWQPETYGFWVPGIGLVFSILVLIIVGALAANLFGRTLMGLGEQMVGRMPVVRGVYNTLKQIFETVLSKSQSSFQTVGLIEYPRLGVYSIVFISTDTTGEIASKCEDQDLISVFIPTTPNPTSGYLLFVPRKDILLLDMSVEEAAKLVISAGLVVPEYLPRSGAPEVTEAEAAPGAAKAPEGDPAAQRN